MTRVEGGFWEKAETSLSESEIIEELNKTRVAYVSTFDPLKNFVRGDEVLIQSGKKYFRFERSSHIGGIGKVHSVRFSDGREWDVINGWR